MVRIKKSNEKLGREIQRERQAKGYTQEELAEYIGISRTHMGHIEQGRKSPSLEVLEKITKVLKIKAGDILPF